MSIINVLPVNDLKEHIEDSTCECRPRVDIVEGGMIIIHHAWDNREVVEQAESIINQQEAPMVDKKALGITEGRIVHYVGLDGSHKAAIIVNAWSGGSYEEGEVNLLVFPDGTNDGHRVFGVPNQLLGGLWWATSVKMCQPKEDGTGDMIAPPNTWHFPER